MITIVIVSFYSGNAQTVVNSLADFQVAVQNSSQEIVLAAGDYYLEDLPSGSRVITCSGSNNIIDLTGARINTLVGSIREVYFIISGSTNVLKNGAIVDYYQSGLDEVTDFSAYNHDRDNLAYGLRGDPVMSITGNGNLVDGLEMTVKGSFPYGYGSQYGIGSTNTFGLSKRCGILITGTEGGGVGNTLDNITMYHRAFGHGIFMQNNATETTIKNSYIEGRMRLSDDMYNDTETYDLPYLTDYRFPSGDDWRTLPFAESYPIPYDVMYPLSEDGIRSYNGSGSVTVENCTVKQMRGGIRLYLATSATVTNSTAIDCGATNFNMPNGGTITGSSGNFSFAPLNDNRLSRSNQDIELTIIPSPNATGPHNLADILGNNHNITFHRTPGPLDSDETRAIVVSGDNSTIINETEYAIILEASSSGNTIRSCGGGTVTDNGTNNTVITYANCEDLANAHAVGDTFTDGDYDYTVTSVSPDEAELSGCALTALVVPSTATDSSNGVTYSITAIGAEVFHERRDTSPLTSVILPSSVVTIKHRAFRRSGLASINLENVVRFEDKDAFSDCNLSAVDLSSATYIGRFALNNNPNIPSIEIPVAQTIADGAFRRLTISQIVIPSSVNTIGATIFDECNALRSIQLEWTDPGDIVHVTGNDIFKNITDPSLITVYVPTGTSADYVGTGWDAVTIVEGTLSVLSLNEVGFAIYPNPVSSIIIIKNANNSTLSIYDIKGSIVFNQAILGDKEVVDLSSLPKGIYFAETKRASSRVIMKLVKE